MSRVKQLASENANRDRAGRFAPTDRPEDAAVALDVDPALVGALVPDDEWPALEDYVLDEDAQDEAVYVDMIDGHEPLVTLHWVPAGQLVGEYRVPDETFLVTTRNTAGFVTSARFVDDEKHAIAAFNYDAQAARESLAGA